MKFNKTIGQKILIGFIALILTSNARAQHSTFGIKGGMNISKLSVSGLQDENNRIGYHFGIFGRIGLTHCFSIQPEALISAKGAELNFNNAIATGGTVLKLQYVDVPLLAVLHMGPFNLHGGPYGSWLIDASVKNNTADGGSDFESEINKDNFHRFDAGLVAGAGIELGMLTAGVRYLHGMCAVGKDKSVFGQPYNFPDGKNTAWQVYVGLRFF